MMQQRDFAGKSGPQKQRWVRVDVGYQWFVCLLSDSSPSHLLTRHRCVTVLGPYVFTDTLLPLLKSTATSPSTPVNSVRIINISSFYYACARTGGVDIQDQFLGGKAPPDMLYAQSKFADSVCSNYWAEQLRKHGIISVAVVSSYSDLISSIDTAC